MGEVAGALRPATEPTHSKEFKTSGRGEKRKPILRSAACQAAMGEVAGALRPATEPTHSKNCMQ
jgi:hypothetical protein